MHTVWANDNCEADVQIFNALGVKVQWPQVECMPAAIKIDLRMPLEFIHSKKQQGIPIVLEAAPVLKNGGYFRFWFSLADILIVNIQEAELILGNKIVTHQSIEKAALELLNFGSKSIFFLGESSSQVLSYDYWTNGATSFWLTQKCLPTKYLEPHSLFSTAITAALALGYVLEDAIIIAKMYVHQTLRQQHPCLKYAGFPENELDIPYLAAKPLSQIPQPFKNCHHLGLYPIVDTFAWVELLLNAGVKTIQLRIKEKGKTLEKEIKQSIALARRYHATLYINDYWELALKFNADGVHLGQSDLDTADLDALRHKNLLLGVSTHCYYEVARAHAINPSYIAIGPIYPTISKEMPFLAQGIESLQRWQRTLKYPLVAIGGINRERIPAVIATGVQGIALISAITKACDPRKITEELLSIMRANAITSM